MIKRLFKSLRNVLVMAILAIAIFLLLSGAINQVKTGQNIVQYITHLGREISYRIIPGEDSKLKVTEDGIYLKDAEVPQEGLFDDLPKDDGSPLDSSEKE